MKLHGQSYLRHKPSGARTKHTTPIGDPPSSLERSSAIDGCPEYSNHTITCSNRSERDHLHKLCVAHGRATQPMSILGHPTHIDSYCASAHINLKKKQWKNADMAKTTLSMIVAACQVRTPTHTLVHALLPAQRYSMCLGQMC